MTATSSMKYTLKSASFDTVLSEIAVALSEVAVGNEVTTVKLVLTTTFQKNGNATQLEKLFKEQGISYGRLIFQYGNQCSLEVTTRASWQFSFPAGVGRRFLDFILGRIPVKNDHVDTYTQLETEIFQKLKALDSAQIPETLNIYVFSSTCLERLVERLGVDNTTRVKSIRALGARGTPEKQALSSITKVVLSDRSANASSIREFDVALTCRAVASRGFVRVQWGLGNAQENISFTFQEFKKTDKLVCGNDTHATIPIVFANVSKEHLFVTPALSPEGEVVGICIEEASSSNGTYESDGGGTLFVRKILNSGDSCELVLGCGLENQKSRAGSRITRDFIQRCLQDPNIAKSPTITFRVN